MAGATLLLRLMHACQVLLCSYGGYQSYLAVTRLQTYESAVKKMAKWSKEVDSQLQRTRTTQASGAVAILASLVTASLLTVAGRGLPAWLRFTASPALLVGVLFARGHIKNFWAPSDGKTVGMNVPLPNMEDYNQAQRATQDLLRTLEWLEYSWVGSSFVVGVLGFS